MTLLSFCNAHLAFRVFALLDGTLLSLESGEGLGLIGRKGAGKPSLLRVIAALEKLDGAIAVSTAPFKGHKGRDRAKTGLKSLDVDASSAALRRVGNS